jgi:histidinol-phosphate aminotransferase
MDIEPYVGGESRVAGQNRIIKLSSNEGAFGTPPLAQAAWAAAAAEGFRYPDGGAAELRAAIGAKFGLDPARIVCGAGSDELLALLTHAYGGPGTEIIVSEYAFSMYEIYGKAAGCRVRTAAERNRTVDVDAMLALVSPATRIAFIANPNNPTGTMIPQAEVERLRRGLPDEALLVLDSAYAEYVDDPAYDAGAKLVDAGRSARSSGWAGRGSAGATGRRR